MIGSLRGTLADRTLAGEALIETAGGVGYRVTMGPTAIAHLGDTGTDIFIWVYHHIREDAQTLYGFTERTERTSFEALIGAHGVGPSLAMAILSVHRPDALYRVLVEDDVTALCLVPGVGKKTAARLLIELKSRLDAGDIAPSTIDALAGGDNTPAGGTMGDVRSALAELGYSDGEIAEAMRGLRDTAGDDVAALLRQALRALGTRK